MTTVYGTSATDHQPSIPPAGASVLDSDGVESNTLRPDAILLAQQGHLVEAEHAFRSLLSMSPSDPVLLHNLAVCLVQQCREIEALSYLQEALRLDPQYAQAHRTLGGLYLNQGEYPRGEHHLRAALAHAPNNSAALNDLGVLLNKTKRPEEALALLGHAARLAPEVADGWNNLGVSLLCLGRLAEARSMFEKALGIDPHHASAFANLGNAYKEEGRLAEAIACYDLALTMASSSKATTRWNRALALLQSGDFILGWEEYEFRWHRRETPPRQFSQPAWQGESVHGKRLLLYAEQGLGDTIQFIRYAKLLKQAGAAIVVEAPRPLAKLLSACDFIDELFVEGEGLSSFDWHAPLMSLPLLCRSLTREIPAPVPYIALQEEGVRKWHTLLRQFSSNSVLRVGVAWQGNPHHAWDRFRSIRLHELARLGEVPRCQFVSLQTGPGSEQLPRCTQQEGRWIFDLPEANKPRDMSDTAALIGALDLVISVDTAMAHLAGALGKPVWILLAAIADWRWQTGRVDTDWYPTARLIRQQQLGDWQSVVGEVTRRLQRLARSKRREARAHQAHGTP